MNSKTVISAITAMCLATSGLAFAQGMGNGNDRGREDQGQRGGQQDRRDNNDGRQADRRDNEGRQQDHQNQNRGYQNERRSSRDGYGAGPSHNYYRGGRLPAEYRHRQYVVDDWRGHNLSAPPRGYHWVQTGSDYVLIAIASGIIASIFLNQY
jgi:Ni/Co efflux regulator RcnB